MAALQAKNEGNEYFKSGAFTQAVGSYTRAMYLDPSEPTYPLNRAMCYLKLYKFPNAESDCSTVIAAHPQNTKAFYRRALARRALGRHDDALRDLESAQAVEPNNKSITDELQSLRSEMQGLSTLSTTTDVNMEPQEPVKRINNDPKSSERPSTSDPLKPAVAPNLSLSNTANEDNGMFMKEVSTRKLSSFMDAKRARENRQWSSTLPGAPLSKGEQEPQQNANKQKSSSTSEPAQMALDNNTNNSFKEQQNTKPFRITPTNSLDFITEWNSCRGQSLETLVQDRWQVLQTISPGSIPKLFASSLEPAIVSEIIQVMSIFGTSNDHSRTIRTILNDLPQSPRWDFVHLFLTKEERNEIHKLVQLYSTSPDEASRFTTSWGL